VAAYLALEGIHPTHLHVQGFSSQVPAESDTTAEGRRRNRRVEVTVR
jgi:outer membrane protein OmpA-like peptidoglycan-associated protein